jgi:bla regulator protein BlaR1
VTPAIVAHLWQSTLFAGAAWLVTLALRTDRAQVRYCVWFTASAKFLIPFSLLIGLGALVPHRAVAPSVRTEWMAALQEISPPLALPATAEDVAITGAATSHGYFAPSAFAFWVCGFLGITICWLLRWRRVHAMRSSARVVSVRTGLKIPVPVMSAPDVIEPGVYGLLRPVLLLPEGIAEQVTPGQLDAILTHELCHVRRMDNLTATIHMVVQAIFWFHPLTWWIGARLVDERERACDEEVLSLGCRPSVYAESILTVCKLYLSAPLACVSGVTGANLKKRIESIMRNDVIRKLNLTKTVILTVAGIASLAVPIVVGVMNAPLLTGQALPASVDSGSTSRPEFEVASIRPAGPMNVRGGGGGISERAGIPGRCVQKVTLDQGRLDIRCYSLGKLMWAWAFGIPPARLAGTAWMGDSASDWTGGQKFDISAKLPDGASRDQVPAMLQNLLTTRFKLITHREYMEQPVYALIAAKGGPTVAPASQNGDTLAAAANPLGGGPMNMNGVSFYGERIPNPSGGGSQIVTMNSPRMGTVRDSDSGSPKHIRRFEAPSITFAGIADLLTIIGIGPEPVIDLTGEKGRHQVVLEMSMAELEALLKDGMRDDIQSAELKAAQDGLKKLGLHLERRKAPIEVLVVDHLEKAPTEN